jgi:hypothetical protein
MWWIYFHYGQQKAADKPEATSAPETVAHSLFTYGHLPIAAGIILTAVGEDFSLSHPAKQSSMKNALAILGARPFTFSEIYGSSSRPHRNCPSLILLPGYLLSTRAVAPVADQFYHSNCERCHIADGGFVGILPCDEQARQLHDASRIHHRSDLVSVPPPRAKVRGHT